MLLSFSCIEPFTPPGIEKYNDVLVIDGRLSNEIPAASVTISSSFQYGKNVTRPVGDALVRIVDEEGVAFNLAYTSKGIYASDSTFIPVTGQKYMLRIVDNKGGVYESDYETLIKAPVIDSVYYNELFNTPYHPYTGEEGVEIHAAAHGDAGNTNYYEWKWHESWMIVPPVNLKGTRPCWQKMSSTPISISSTESLGENRLSDINLFFISSTTSPKLSIRYNAIIKVYSLTRDQYTYLRKLKEINSGSGGFFDPIPGALRGNIHKVDNDNAPVIGLFTASAVNTARLIISRRDLKIRYIETGFSDCIVKAIKWDDPYVPPMLGDMYVAGLIGDDLVLVNIQKCFDCSYVGSPVQPDGWQ